MKHVSGYLWPNSPCKDYDCGLVDIDFDAPLICPIGESVLGNVARTVKRAFDFLFYHKCIWRPH